MSALPLHVQSRIGSVLTQVANRIMDRAQNEFIPYESHKLQESREIDPPVRSGLLTEVTMAFGRSGEPYSYALAIHELTEGKHTPPSWETAMSRGNPIHFRHGGPKYLERPFFEEGARLPAALAAARMFK
jgi:hypothetical protein